MVGTWIASVKQALTLLGQAEDAAPDVSNVPVADLVILGQRLWWIGKRVNKMLDPIKVRLRAEAQTSQGACRFDAVDGSHCLVIPHSASLNLRKDADVGGLKQLLGDRFPEFFDEVITCRPRKDFQIKTAGCTTDVQAALLESIDMSDRTPRVVFKD